MKKSGIRTISYSHYIAHFFNFYINIALYFEVIRSRTPISIPLIAHTFAESSLVCQLANTSNNIIYKWYLILKKN